MPKFRQYTNLERTPPSMAWLINECAKLKGMIERRQKQMDDLPREIVELQSKLDALDAVIPLHEVKVDPEIINFSPVNGGNFNFSSAQLRMVNRCGCDAMLPRRALLGKVRPDTSTAHGP